jgi:Fe-S-cluster-containing dehydrogenase component
VKEACIGCRMCMLGCPFGVIAFNSAEGVIAKCDTCDGDPECVRFCTPHALEFRESELADMPKGRDFARRVAEAAKG